MKLFSHRLAELVALWSVAIGCLILAAYMLWLGRTGEAFGAVLGIIPLCLNRIGNLGQAQVMNNMADHLAKSAPTKEQD